MELRDMHAYCIKGGTLEASSWQGQLCMVWTLEEIGGSLEIADWRCDVLRLGDTRRQALQIIDIDEYTM